jgi:hypothetical protein
MSRSVALRGCLPHGLRPCFACAAESFSLEPNPRTLQQPSPRCKHCNAPKRSRHWRACSTCLRRLGLIRHDKSRPTPALEPWMHTLRSTVANMTGRNCARMLNALERLADAPEGGIAALEAFPEILNTSFAERPDRVAERRLRRWRELGLVETVDAGRNQRLRWRLTERGHATLAACYAAMDTAEENLDGEEED